MVFLVPAYCLEAEKTKTSYQLTTAYNLKNIIIKLFTVLLQLI